MVYLETARPFQPALTVNLNQFIFRSINRKCDNMPATAINKEQHLLVVSFDQYYDFSILQLIEVLQYYKRQARMSSNQNGETESQNLINGNRRSPQSMQNFNSRYQNYSLQLSLNRSVTDKVSFEDYAKIIQLKKFTDQATKKYKQQTSLIQSLDFQEKRLVREIINTEQGFDFDQIFQNISVRLESLLFSSGRGQTSKLEDLRNKATQILQKKYKEKQALERLIEAKNKRLKLTNHIKVENLGDSGLIASKSNLIASEMGVFVEEKAETSQKTNNLAKQPQRNQADWENEAVLPQDTPENQKGSFSQIQLKKEKSIKKTFSLDISPQSFSSALLQYYTKERESASNDSIGKKQSQTEAKENEEMLKLITRSKSLQIPESNKEQENSPSFMIVQEQIQKTKTEKKEEVSKDNSKSGAGKGKLTRKKK